MPWLVLVFADIHVYIALSSDKLGRFPLNYQHLTQMILLATEVIVLLPVVLRWFQKIFASTFTCARAFFCYHTVIICALFLLFYALLANILSSIRMISCFMSDMFDSFCAAVNSQCRLKVQ